jgi:hypothetical protein
MGRFFREGERSIIDAAQPAELFQTKSLHMSWLRTGRNQPSADYCEAAVPRAAPVWMPGTIAAF